MITKALSFQFYNALIYLLIMICALYNKSYAQTIVIDSTFSSNAEIFPFNQDDTIYGLGITGNITLYSDTSLVRVIFINSDFEEYLLYEAYPYITDSWDVDIVNEADETKYLTATKPYSIIVQTCNASLDFTSLIISGTITENPDSLQAIHKENLEQIKISNINANIQEHEMLWLAGKTSVSSLQYSEKKKLFGSYYNFQGFDYYLGGVYDITKGTSSGSSNSTIVPGFDWRDRHGANNQIFSNSPYYDNFLGWMTPVDKQDCNHCWVFAPVHATEALVNLYFNQQLNLDLSEQSIPSCQYPIDDCSGGDISTSFTYLKTEGIVDENCFPYQDSPAGNQNPCNNICLNPTEKIKINNSIEIDQDEDIIKETIINRGPVVMNIQSWWHYMVFCGFGRINYLDTYCNYSNDTLFHQITDPDDPLIGKSYWIVKNSWGTTGWGENGFGRIICPISEFTEREYIALPLLSEVNQYTIECRDYDNDGYFNWGISEQKPETCPTCPDDRDSDDTNPRIGPYDNHYYGIPIKPIMEVSVLGQTVHNGGFYPINELSQNLDISFNVRNKGNAQLNFELESSIPTYTKVTLSGNDAGSFSYGEDLATELAMKGETGDQDDFTISYDGTCTGTCTCVVTIHLDEFDMEDFTFAIVYADCDHIPSNERITSTATWDGWNVILDNYNIKDGGELSISGNVGFSDQVNLVVEPGGRLILDGGTLTNVCGNTWKGIDVWGDASLCQYPNSNQGYLAIKNGGTIQNADIAVQVADAPDVNTYTVLTTGGIVKCDSAIFINNWYDVVIYPYQNINPATGLEAPNYCTFKNSYFLSTYPFEEARRHVTLWGVDGIRFRGCTFENETDFVDTPLNEKIDVGIFSHNSGFYVEDYCMNNTIPCNNTRRCSFTKLRYGIYAINSMYSKYICIDTAVFLNNLTGIYMSGVDEQRITSNEFTLDYYQDFEVAYNNPKPVGLYLEACKYYMVEENSFTNESTIENATGIHILNSGPYVNEVYNNFFKGFYCGITAAGENRDDVGTGLCIKCNDFASCLNDIHVTDEGGLAGYFGIAYLQGDIAPEPPQGQTPDPTYAAGNTFTEMDVSYTNYINNLLCNSIKYTYHGDVSNPEIKVEPDPTSPEQPTLHIDLTSDDEVSYNSKEEACPSNLRTIIDIPSEMNMMASESSMLNAYEDTLNLFVDGGDTETLNQDVQLSFPDEALEIRQELLNSSPYLSDTVMKSSIAKENVLPNVMIRDVLVANPQSAKSQSVLESLDNRFTPMPDYMMNEIMMGQYMYGNKELLEQKLSKHKRSRDLVFAKLMRHYHSDTINTAAASDSIISLLNDQDYLGTRYQLSMFYLNKHDSVNAYSTLNNIPIDFDLTSNEQSTWQLYSDLFDINWEIMNDTMAIDSVHISNLLGIYNSQNTLPALYARNTLISVGELIYNEPVFLPSVLKVTPIWQKQPDIKPSSKLYVYPNPAYSYFIVEYSMDSFSDNAYLILTDMSGKHMKSIDISCQQNQIVVPVEDLPNGVYLIQLLKNNNTIESKKIIVSK